MKKACVIGHPVAHSLSPTLHFHWLKQYQIEGQYDARDISPEQLKRGIHQLVAEGYCGFNVTIPHKETILNLLDKVDDLARQIGAVNTVVIEDGRLRGTNTDAFGFSENLRAHFSQASLAADPYQTPVVLGAGGAARAIIKALSDAKAKVIYVVARDTAKAAPLKSLADNIEIHAWERLSQILPKASLLINTTPLGMEGKEAASMDLNGLPKEAVVTDIVYTPLLTPLLKEAQRRGHFVVDGLGMLIYQAIPGFKVWFQQEPKLTWQDFQQLKQLLVQP